MFDFGVFDYGKVLFMTVPADNAVSLDLKACNL